DRRPRDHDCACAHDRRPRVARERRRALSPWSLIVGARGSAYVDMTASRIRATVAVTSTQLLAGARWDGVDFRAFEAVSRIRALRALDDWGLRGMGMWRFCLACHERCRIWTEGAKRKARKSSRGLKRDARQGSRIGEETSNITVLERSPAGVHLAR